MLTFQEIAEIHPFMKNEKESDWHRHPKGGGWVQNTATVDDMARVSEEAIVYERSDVLSAAQVLDRSQVFGDALILGYGLVKDTAQVYGHAQVRESACVRNQAKIEGWVILDSRAEVTGGTWKISPTYINGSAHVVTHSAPGMICIGCEEHEIDYWLKHYKEIGATHNYTMMGLDEYKAYIDLIALRDQQLFGG